MGVSFVLEGRREFCVGGKERDEKGVSEGRWKAGVPAPSLHRAEKASFR